MIDTTLSTSSAYLSSVLEITCNATVAAHHQQNIQLRRRLLSRTTTTTISPPSHLTTTKITIRHHGKPHTPRTEKSSMPFNPDLHRPPTTAVLNVCASAVSPSRNDGLNLRTRRRISRKSGTASGIAREAKIALRLERDLENDTHIGMGNTEIGRQDSNRSDGIDDSREPNGILKYTIANSPQVNVPKTRYVNRHLHSHPRAYDRPSNRPLSPL